MSTKKDGSRTKEVTTKSKTGSTSKKKIEEEKNVERIKRKEPSQATAHKTSSRTASTIKTVKDERIKAVPTKSTIESSRETPRTRASSIKPSTNVLTKHSTSKTTKSTDSRAAKKTNSSETRTSHHTVTTPSSRITSVPFFPSKNIYTNALPEETLKKIRKTEAAKASKDDDKKHTLRVPSARVTSVSSEQSSIREFIKEKRHEKHRKTREKSPESNSISERPGTATLRRGSIVNKNIVGPEAPKPTKVKRSSSQKTSDQVNLELQKRVKVKTSTLPHDASSKVKVNKVSKPERSTTDHSVSSRENSILEQVDSKRNLSTKPKVEDMKETPKSESSDENKYEDDFESYESDFEAYSSTSSPISPKLSDISGEISTSSDEEVHKHVEPTNVASHTDQVIVTLPEEEKDSGHFELPDYRQKQMLHSIKESIEKENAHLDHPRTNPASLSDEGFEDAKSLQFFNFAAARKKLHQQKILEKRKKRGEDLLSMITLDSVNYTILDIPPVPYDEYMRIYGSRNTLQSSVQTGDDDVDEETQTEDVDTTEVWTQYPSVFLKRQYEDTDDFWKSYKRDLLGVCGKEEKEQVKGVNESHLEKFMTSAGGLMLEVLTETAKADLDKLEKNKQEIPFSDGYIGLEIGFLPWLKGYPVRALCFCDSNSNRILTAHGLKDEGKRREIDDRSLVCVWNLASSLEPEKVLSVFGDVSACCFGFDEAHMVFGGLVDGTMVVWNTKESEYVHESLSEVEYSHIRLRSPTFITSIGDSHLSKVVRIQAFGDIQVENKYFRTVLTREVCSLEEDGEIIIWGIVKKQMDTNKDLPFDRDHLFSPWVSVALVKNIAISAAEIHTTFLDLQCTDFIMNKQDGNKMYVGTNYGHVLQCSVNRSTKNMKKFSPGVASECICLETCHFSPKYFIAGYDDGIVRLYTIDNTKPLAIYKSSKDTTTSAITFVNWSSYNPFLFYVTDESNTVHVWDLFYSDLFPLHSVQFDKDITYVALSCSIERYDSGRRIGYLAIGTKDGTVNVHVLNDNGLESSENSQDENWKKFLSYVDHL